jgi:plastocyanin
MTPSLQKQPDDRSPSAAGRTVHTVQIDFDGKGFLYTIAGKPGASEITVHPGDHVTWHSGVGNYTILFKNDSPFTEIAAHGRKDTRTVPLEVTGKMGTYRYAVTVALPNGLIVDDPVIIVGNDGDGT